MEKKRSIWRSIYRILVILVVISTLIWAFFSPVFTISDVIIVGNKNVDIESVRPAVPIALNLWRYPTSKVINNIKNVSPLISDVAIYRGVPNTIKVDIAEKVVAVLWQSGENEFLVGIDGKVIMKPDKDYMVPKVIDRSGILLSAGDIVANLNIIKFIQDVKYNYETVVGSPLDHFEVGATMFEISVISTVTPKMILDTQRDAKLQLEAARLVLDQEKDKIKEYIDLRVIGKAYIK